MYQHIVAKAKINRALYNVDSDLCKKYADYTGHFQDVRKAVGDEIFLESVKYIPDMIISAVDNPDYPKWLLNSQISYECQKIMYDSYYATEDLLGKKIPENENQFFCLRNALIYEDLSKLSPQKATLVWKYWLKKESEDKK
jgi:hypothetical protein